MIHYYLKRLLSNSSLSETPKFSLNHKKTYCKVVKVYDGDTITINMRVHKKIRQFSIRMYGYDTPEIYSKNLIEKEKAQVAKLFLQNLLIDKLVFIDCGDFDKYGRLLGNIYLTKKDYLSNNSVNDLMVSEGYGKPYFGGTK